MDSKKKRLLVLGANGMLGSAIFRYFLNDVDYVVAGTVRTQERANMLRSVVVGGELFDVNIEDADRLIEVFCRFTPDIVINCIGLVKQLGQSKDPLTVIPINSIFPHRVANLCNFVNARLIHVSTDCVFSGERGGYKESDRPDAMDLYGLTKYIGEVITGNAITLRTSIIGHELSGGHSLLEWFLAQSDYVLGYGNAIFSGLPTVELARIIKDYVIPNFEMSGLYHISTIPISKYHLLKLIANEYCKDIQIRLDEDVKIDRSLDSSLFRSQTGYEPESWPELVRRMHAFG